MAINVTTSKQQITASVAEDKISANVSAGFGATGPQGPSGVIDVTAPITNSGTTTAANVGLSVGTGLSVSGGALVLGTHTHDDRYYTETEVNSLLSGYATLVGGKVPAANLPSYVDDVVEVASYGALPASGETGKIYLVTGTNQVYRWTGFVYVEIVASPGSTDAVPEGSVNLYHTNVRAAAAAPVQSVAGKTGSVVLAAGDIASGTLSASRLPIAAAGTLGAVRIGSGISIDGDGIISASAGYTLPTATNSVLGGVKIGSGVTITDGVISVSTNYAAASHTHAWNDITSKPFSTVGYGLWIDNDTDLRSVFRTDETFGDPDAGYILGNVTTHDGKLWACADAATPDSPTTAPSSWTLLASLDYDDLTNTPTLGTAAAADTGDFAAASHAHSASDVTSGTFDIARIPTGTSSTTVSLGNHTHSQLHDRSHAITSTDDHTAGNWKVFYSNGSGQVVELALGAANTVLQCNGASAAPTFGTVQKTITSGTAAPTGGSDGDIYLQYS